MNTRDTLLAYSEWLDSLGLVASDLDEDDDQRSHDELAQEFIDQWEGTPLPTGESTPS